MNETAAIDTPIENFLKTIDKVYGSYLDATVGFHQVSKMIEQAKLTTGLPVE